MSTERERFELWFYTRWPEFGNATDSAFEAWCAGRDSAYPAVPQGVDPTMTHDELVAAAESIGMRFPAVPTTPLTEIHRALHPTWYAQPTVPLTDEQIDDLIAAEWVIRNGTTHDALRRIARAVLAAALEKP